jgi:hypothetical protein
VRRKPVAIVAALIGVGVVAAIVTAAFMLTTRSPTREDYDRVIVGMHREDAVEILGTPNEIEPGNNRELLHFRTRVDADIVVVVQGEHVESKRWVGRTPRYGPLRLIWRWMTNEWP